MSLAGERGLVVPAGKEAAFRRALRKAGFATAPAGGRGGGPRGRAEAMTAAPGVVLEGIRDRPER